MLSTDTLADNAVTNVKLNRNTMMPKIIKATKAMSDSTGNTSYTGVGFKPSSVIAMFYGPGTSTAGIGVFTTNDAWGWGFNGSAVAYQDSTSTIFSLSPASSQAFNATLISMDNDGFTLKWTKIGSPSGTSQLMFLCYR